MDRPTRPPPPLHVRRPRDRDPPHDADRPAAHADGHLSEHRHPGRQHRLELRRPLGARNGEPHRVELRARAHHHRQRHRAHRVPVARRRRRRQGLLPAAREDRGRGRAGHRDRPDDPAAAAAGHDAAPRHHLQRVERAHPPARPLGPGHLGAAALRSRQQLHPHAARDRRGRRDPVPVRRQAAPGPGRHRPRRPPVAGTRAERRRQRDQRAEPDPADRHGQDRRLRIRDRDQQQPDDDPGAERPADPRGRRRGGLHPRRRAGSRRLPAADQHRARRRPARGAADDPQDRQRVDAGHRRAGARDARADEGLAPAEPQDHAARGSVPLRPRLHRRRREGGADRGLPHGADDPALPRKLAQHAHHRGLDPALDPDVDLHPLGAGRDASTS